MTITVELPDDVATHKNPSREALEALAIAGYKAATLSQYQAATLLDMDRFQFEGFLKDRNIMDHAYDIDDLRHDIEVMDRLDYAGLLGR
jgi:predicted HTH domain antitoxin